MQQKQHENGRKMIQLADVIAYKYRHLAFKTLLFVQCIFITPYNSEKENTTLLLTQVSLLLSK